MKPDSQRKRILSMLRRGPVCGTTLLAEHIPRYSARIFELRGEGHTIQNRKCGNALHAHETKQTEFVLWQTELF